MHLELGPNGAKGVDTLAIVANRYETSPQLSESEHQYFRRLVGRPIYISMDRPDVQIATRQLAKRVQHPATLACRALKRCSRYFKKSGRMCLGFDGRVRNDISLFQCDFHSSGGLPCRRGACGGLILTGLGQLLSPWSRTQKTVAQSSCGAALAAVVTAVSETMVLQSLLQELNCGKMEIHVCTDSKAASD